MCAREAAMHMTPYRFAHPRLSRPSPILCLQRFDSVIAVPTYKLVLHAISSLCATRESLSTQLSRFIFTVLGLLVRSCEEIERDGPKKGAREGGENGSRERASTMTWLVSAIELSLGKSCHTQAGCTGAQLDMWCEQVLPIGACTFWTWRTMLMPRPTSSHRYEKIYPNASICKCLAISIGGTTYSYYAVMGILIYSYDLPCDHVITILSHADIFNWDIDELLNVCKAIKVSCCLKCKSRKTCLWSSLLCR